jgi:hypothetical protein
MTKTIEIPENYQVVVIHDDVLSAIKEIINPFNWHLIENPTISEVAKYVGVSVPTIKKDVRNIKCPLRVKTKGKKGKGNETVFFKATAEHYKNWKNEK